MKPADLSAVALNQRELAETGEVLRYTRVLLRRRLSQIARQQKTLPPGEQTAISAELVAITNSLGTSFDRIAKNLMRPGSAPDDTTADMTTILAELTKGKIQ